MNFDQPQNSDPILAMLPAIRGRHILKPCVLYARLGRGGMGAVYLAKHLTLMQKQVVKCLWLMGGGNPGDGSFVDRFQQEARIAAEMTHQNLVRVTHVDRVGELHYLVMEYVEGEDLERRVARSGPLPEEAALTATLGAAQGLGYAHTRGIVHRDVKPANLMISTHGEVKVIDLGLAKAIDTTRQLGATVGTLGTPLYMAPEQWQGADVGPAADVWALGAVLYFLLTGHSLVPAEGASTTSIRDLVTSKQFADAAIAALKVSRNVKRVLRRCLALDPNDRYHDARALADELAQMIPGDEQLLIEGGAGHQVQGDEPSDDELRMLQDVLANRDTAPLAGSDGLQTMPAQSVVKALPDAHGGDRQSPATAGTVPQRPTTAARPSRNAGRHRSSHIGKLSAAVTTLLLGVSAVVMWPRVDYQAIQQQAMAAIYQERFADAERLLQSLEAAPAFADQARRLRIDALIKDGQRMATEQPIAALQRFEVAKEVAQQLLITRDTDDATRRIANARQPIAAKLQTLMAASLGINSPLPGSVITQGTPAVIARFEPGPLRLRASIQGRELQRGEDGQWRGEWHAPLQDGKTELQVIVSEPQSKLQHMVAVPVVVRRGAVALHIEAPARPSNHDQPELAATVDNGPLEVTARVTTPDGMASDLNIGTQNGAFAFAFPCEPNRDGIYRVQLLASFDGKQLLSPECQVVVDRAAPVVSISKEIRHCAANTLLLQGEASEACQLYVVGNESLRVATDEHLRFALPVNLVDTEGRTTMQLGARDNAGNVDNAAAVIEVHIDRTPPELLTESLQYERAVAGAQLSIVGQLSEPGTLAIDDGEAIATSDDGRFQVAIDLLPGDIEQTANVRLLARDLAGNATAARTLQVLIDRRGPRILPGATDGSWWQTGYWVLRVEDASTPCQVTLAGETKEVPADGIVRFPRRASNHGALATAQDRLGNQCTRKLSGPGSVTSNDGQPPGPNWGTPTVDSVIDPLLHLHERVKLTIAGHDIVMRLVRPLRAEELPPDNQRDARAAALLQGQSPFYLAETEVPTTIWSAYAAQLGGATSSHKGYRFDPSNCKVLPNDDATWQHPVHVIFADSARAADRSRWPVTQVSPDDAQAFCKLFEVRLPTETEWRFVTRMGTRYRYGWARSTSLEQIANLADLKLAALAPNLQAFDPVDDGFASLAPVDAFPTAAQAHPWGFRNLLGNAAEWCATADNRVVACGGSWQSEPRELRVDHAQRQRAITTGAWDTIGFRIAKDL